jgi:hypothetical protein
VAGQDEGDVAAGSGQGLLVVADEMLAVVLVVVVLGGPDQRLP